MSREYDSGQRHRDLNEIGEAKIEKGQFKSGEQSLGLNFQIVIGHRELLAMLVYLIGDIPVNRGSEIAAT